MAKTHRIHIHFRIKQRHVLVPLLTNTRKLACKKTRCIEILWRNESVRCKRAIPFAEHLREAVMHFNAKARALLKFSCYKLDCFWLDFNCRFYVYIFVSLECQALPYLFHWSNMYVDTLRTEFCVLDTWTRQINRISDGCAGGVNAVSNWVSKTKTVLFHFAGDNFISLMYVAGAQRLLSNEVLERNVRFVWRSRGVPKIQLF